MEDRLQQSLNNCFYIQSFQSYFNDLQFTVRFDWNTFVVNMRMFVRIRCAVRHQLLKKLCLLKLQLGNLLIPSINFLYIKSTQCVLCCATETKTEKYHYYYYSSSPWPVWHCSTGGPNRNLRSLLGPDCSTYRSRSSNYPGSH